MPPAFLARVTCPNCQTQFQTPVEQVVDVRADPDAKMRVLNGLVNVAACQQCGMQGPLNLPFLYHDPDKELALIYMPMEAARDNLERQRLIGNMTSAVINNLPPEERKAYLLQPQEFLTLDNMMHKILNADGVTSEMIAEQKSKAELLQRMLDAASEEILEAMIKANDDVIDGDFFQMLNMNLEATQSANRTDIMQRLLLLSNKLLELSSQGQAIKAQSGTLEALRADPTRENLVELLAQAPNEQTRVMLVTVGRPMMDYLFFQALTARIDSADDKGEAERLIALRTEVLEIRDQLVEQARALYAERAALLRDLVLSDDPETLARQRFRELDRDFFNVMAANLEEARSAGDHEAAESLQKIWTLLMRLVDESLPPEVRLVNQLVAAEDDAEIERLLQENRNLLNERLAQFMAEAEANMRETDALEAAERLVHVREKIKQMRGGTIAT